MFVWYTGSSDRPPALLNYRTSTAFITATVAFAIFTDIFVYGIIVPVIPFALTERAGIPENDIQYWISILLAIYGAALLVTAPFCGWLADRSSSRRTPLLLGLLALAGSTVMLCVGRSIGVIAAGRVLQGMSAAVVWVVGLALLVDTVGGDEIGQAMGHVGVAMSLGVLLAPLLGGVVFENAGYYSVWAMAFALIGLDIVLRLVMVERKIAVRWDSRFEPKRAEVNSSEQTGMAKQLDEKPDGTESEDDNNKTKETASSPTDQHSNEEDNPNARNKWFNRLPPVLKLLASRRLLSALWAVLIQSSLLTSFDSVLPLFTKNTFGWNATGAGLIFLPIVVPTFAGPVIGHLSDKQGPRWYATAGFIGCAPFLIMLRLVDHDSLRQKVLLCALLVLIGLFLTLALIPMMAEVTYAVMDKEGRRPKGYYGKNGAYAQAYSLFNMAWAAGCMVGPLLAGLVVNSKGWPTATLILGCVSIFTALPVVIWTGGSWRKRKGRDMQAERTARMEAQA
jgi:MFS family permease